MIINKNYGFLHKDFMPYGDFEEIRINNLENIDWAVTGPYSDMAKNHCSSVCVTNLYKIYRSQGLTCDLVDTDEIFKKVYGFFGNGPIIALGWRAKRFFKSIGFKLKMKKHRSLEDIKASLENDEPVALLVNGGLLKWHWVICVGIRTYKDGTMYYQIMDNWNRNIDHYLKIKKSFTWFRALKFIQN